MTAPDQRLQRARTLRAQGALEEAHRLLDSLLADAPTSARAFNDRGCVRVDLGQIDGAVRDLAEAVRLDPGFEEAKRNFEIVANLVPAAGGVAAAASTVSAVLAQATHSGSFASSLLEFLRGAVDVPAGQEDRREDAIQEVALRVLGLSRSEDVPLAEALRRLRRSSTRAWVRSLLGVSLRKDLPSLTVDVAAPGAAEESAGALRLDAVLDELKADVLAASKPATRWRRRIVWDVYVGSLLEGVRLTRAEVVKTVRVLEVSRRRAKDSQILADLDLISASLRSASRHP